MLNAHFAKLGSESALLKLLYFLISFDNNNNNNNNNKSNNCGVNDIAKYM